MRVPCRFSGLLTLCVAAAALAAPGDFTAASEHGTLTSEAELAVRLPAVRGLLESHCIDCHDEASHAGGVRLDQVTAVPTAATRSLFERVARQLRAQAMPPEEAGPLADREREQLLAWAADGLAAFDARPVPRNGSVRRLTVTQYRHAIRDLLGIDEDVAGGIPADAISKEGFTNQSATLQLSPRQLEAYLEAALRAVHLAVVDPSVPPRVQRFRVELGQGINHAPRDEPLILGHISRLLPAADVRISQPVVDKPFACEPIAMQTSFRFIEGYQGNDTVRGWRDFEGIEHAVFACVRGSEGDDVKDFLDPRGRGFETVPEGLLLRPSIPSEHYLGVDSKYGPLPNFKIAVRELPHEGRFRVTVRAACEPDLLVVPPAASMPAAEAVYSMKAAEEGGATVSLPEGGIYLVLVELAGVGIKQPQSDGQPAADSHELALVIRPHDTAGKDTRHASHAPRRVTARWSQPAFAVVRLPAGPVTLQARYAGSEPIEAISLARLDPAVDLARRFVQLEARRPWLGVHLGLRRDCGSTLAAVGTPQRVSSFEPRDFVFEGSIANFPDPQVEAGNPNYLAGLREIAVRSEYTSDRDMPRLLVQSVEFEGPLHEQWPPPPHAAVFDVPGGDAADAEARARGILGHFATRAFRRPVRAEELEGLMAIWRQSHAATGDERQAIRDGLVATLVAPQFLFIVEESATPAAEPLDDFELASKLSFFLWNHPPDDRLLSLAADGTLRESLVAETDRLIDDGRFDAFADVFAAEWLRLDRFDVVEIDRTRSPHLTRHVRPHLREEPARLLAWLIRTNAAADALVRCDTLLVNEAVAAYYGLDSTVESGFDFVPVPHDRPDLGGLLTLPAVLSGLSNGREPDPVKRGAWLARTIIARPPADPPPNVPKLEDLTHLSLRERLEQHRSAKGCTTCHEGIDPWGLPFEGYGADGLAVTASPGGTAIDARSRLPDGTEVDDFEAFRDYLVERQPDRLAMSIAWHLATYAIGRRPTPAEDRWLEEMTTDVCRAGGGLRNILQKLIASELFLTK